jgi:hypothetical protein
VLLDAGEPPVNHDQADEDTVQLLAKHWPVVKAIAERLLAGVEGRDTFVMSGDQIATIWELYRTKGE